MGQLFLLLAGLTQFPRLAGWAMPAPPFPLRGGQAVSSGIARKLLKMKMVGTYLGFTESESLEDCVCVGGGAVGRNTSSNKIFKRFGYTREELGEINLGHYNCNLGHLFTSCLCPFLYPNYLSLTKYLGRYEQGSSINLFIS